MPGRAASPSIPQSRRSRAPGPVTPGVGLARTDERPAKQGANGPREWTIGRCNPEVARRSHDMDVRKYRGVLCLNRRMTSRPTSGG
jgi:hypothetical protein